MKENGYRFQDSSHNNYVLLNNELWRIIGIFEFEQKNLIKLIKVNSIGEFKWDSKNKNDKHGIDILRTKKQAFLVKQIIITY